MRLRALLVCLLIVALGALVATTLRGAHDTDRTTSATSASVTAPRAGTAAPPRRAVVVAGEEPGAEAPPGDDDWPPDVRLHLVVVADDDDTPIRGARVWLWPSDHLERVVEGTTDDAGRVTLDLLRAAYPMAFVQAEGFVPERLDDAEDREVRLVRGLPLDGRVLHAETAAPIAGAQVFALGTRDRSQLAFDATSDATSGSGIRTDAEGRFHLSGLPPRSATLLLARADGFGAARVRIEPGDAPGECVLRLGGGAVIEGTVTRSDGVPVAGATVRILDARDPLLVAIVRGPHAAGDEVAALDAIATTGADGRYRVAGLTTPGRYVAVHLEGTIGSGFRDAGLSQPGFLAAPGDTAHADVRIAGGVHLRGGDFAPDGSPAELRRVEWTRVSGRPDFDGFTSSIDRNGSEFDGTFLAPGEFALEFVPKGPWPHARMQVTLADGETRAVEVRFREGFPIAGVVADDLGVAAKQVLVSAPGCVSTRTDDAGAFELIAPDDAERTVSIEDRDEGRVEGFGRYVPAEIHLRPGGEPARVVVRRVPRVSFRLVADDGLPDGLVAQVGVRTSDASPSRWLRVPDDGWIDVPFVPEDVPFDVTVAFRDDEFAPFVIEGVVAARGAALDLGVRTLMPCWLVSGTVLDAGGGAASGAFVAARGRGETTGRDGSFLLRTVEDPVWITVRLEGHADLHARVRRRDAPTLRLEPGVPVTIALTGVETADASTLREARPIELHVVPPGARPRTDGVWTTRTVRPFADVRLRLLPGRYDVWAEPMSRYFLRPGRPERPPVRLGTITVTSDGPSRFEFEQPRW